MSCGIKGKQRLKKALKDAGVEAEQSHGNEGYRKQVAADFTDLERFRAFLSRTQAIGERNACSKEFAGRKLNSFLAYIYFFRS